MISDATLDSAEFKARAREREKQTTAAGIIALGVFVGGSASLRKEKAPAPKAKGGQRHSDRK
jgi:hypothetical protein